MALNKLRKDIESIDLQMLKLLAKRNKISKKIGKYKKKYSLRVVVNGREKKLLAKIRSKSRKLGLNTKFTTEIFNKIIKDSRKLQR